MKKALNMLVVFGLVAGCIGEVSAQTYKIDRYSINAGGGSSSGGGYILNSSIGQAAAGFAKSTSFLEWVGFWAGSVPNPTVVESLQSAKMLANGAFVSVAGKVVTAGIEDFSGVAYIEETDRTSGIRVHVPASVVDMINRGKIINVIGTMGTTSAGERYIAASLVVVVSTATVPLPLGMNNQSVGGGAFGTPPSGQFGATGASGLNNIGLLIKTWGRVTASGADYIELDDGSGPVRIDTTTLASPPQVGSDISVIGISSLGGSSVERLKLVLPRRGDDITGD